MFMSKYTFKTIPLSSNMARYKIFFFLNLRFIFHINEIFHDVSKKTVFNLRA